MEKDLYQQTTRVLCLTLISLLISACSPDGNNNAVNDSAQQTADSFPSQSSPTQAATTQTAIPGQAPGQGSEEKPTVIWAKPGFAPLFISEEPFKGEGTGDLIFQTLQTLLPQFNHVNTKANYTRIIAEMKKGTDICALLFYNETREDFAVYSDPLAITPSYHIYASLEGKAALDKAFGRNLSQAPLDELLSKSGDLSLLITPHQSYGKKRDDLLAKHKDSLNTQLHLTDLPAMMKIVATNRAQLMLAMPWVFNYEQDNLGLHGRTAKIELTDVPAYQASYLVCSKNPLGRQVVATINNIDPAAHTVLKDAMASWLLPEEHQDYYRAYREYFAAYASGQAPK
ncbi:MAG: hypothetical protein AseanaTS_00710 [Candidatus Pelagadaptatus aseana]|uniref:hypothetical protein n=1 Tax=Candidatus Pelagadaptatus aseana TaxID=3120508 RepID=UPI0039B35568